MWYYGLEKDNLNESARIVLHMLLFIMFCYFQKRKNGWHPRIPICGAQIREQGKNARQRNGEEWACSQVVSNRYFYVYHLYVRDSPQPPLFYGGKLFQQFVVDTWANCEQRRLNWARTHQHTLRSELY